MRKQVKVNMVWDYTPVYKWLGINPERTRARVLTAERGLLEVGPITAGVTCTNLYERRGDIIAEFDSAWEDCLTRRRIGTYYERYTRA
jgi:hypothetical protein